MNLTFRLSDPSGDRLADTISRILAPALSSTEDLATRQRALELMRTTSTVVGAVDDEVVVALCVELTAPGEAQLAAIAVTPDHRGLGYGRSAMEWAINHLSLNVLTAETDIDAVGFYRRTGWTVTTLGEKYPGVERFRCRWQTSSERARHRSQ